jgi:DNA replication protein DnaC
VKSGETTVHCVCQCRREREIAEEKQRKKMERVSKLRANGIHDANIRNWNFENADKANPKLMDKAHRYCDKWTEMHDENIGLLLFGNVGTGKTYIAACIANALIDRGIPVLMTNFPKILNDLSGFKEEDKNSYINSLNEYELLIIDDLGVERQSDFALEQVFSVIDSRYKNGQPLIVTTNLSMEDLKAPASMKEKRIYDRILEMTIPIKVDGLSRREQLHKDKLELAKELLAD